MAFALRSVLGGILLVTLLPLAGCGGGGSDGDGAGPPVTISQHPGSRTAKPGASVTFSGAASGNPGFQWERSVDRMTWSPIPGATSASYTFTAQTADNGAWFHFRASSGGQTVTSDSAQLTVTTVSAAWRLEGSLWGVAVDAQGNVYASDFTGAGIRKVSPAGAALATWGTAGNGDGQLSTPKYLATDASDNVYVADSGNSRVQKFSSSGTWLAKWGTHGEPAGGAPAPDGTFNGPTGIAVDRARGWVYVVDSNNSRVQKFDLAGAFLAKWGEYGTGDGQFRFFGAGQGPEGSVAVDASGDVYVVDNMNGRVQKFTSDGVYLAQFGSPGTGGGQFSYPSGIAVDDAGGHVYVVDNTTNGNLPGNVCKVMQWSLAGAFQSAWQAMSPDGTPEAAIAVATDAAGNVYLTQGMSIGKYVP